MEEIKKAIFDYCKNTGIIRDIKAESNTPEAKRFEGKRIRFTGLGVLDAVRCVLDKERTDLFLEEIKGVIKKGDRVLEAGIGTGIMSFAASAVGAKVVGLELNKSVLSLAKKMTQLVCNGKVSKPFFQQANALRYKSKRKFDCIISENIYTGMFYEKQIQIMNHLYKYLRSGGLTIPSKMNLYFSLCEISNTLAIQKLPLIVVSELRPKNNGFKVLSRQIRYSVLDFKKHNDEFVNFCGEICAFNSGTVNSVYITSSVEMPSGKILKGSKTTFFANDIIIPIKLDRKIKKGDRINLKLSYKFGGSPRRIKVSVI